MPIPKIATQDWIPADQFPVEGVYAVRDLVVLSEPEVKQLPIRHYIQFDNGVQVVSTRNATIFSHRFWQLFRPYPNVQIIPKHHVDAILKGKSLDAGTHLKLCTAIYKTIVLEAPLVLPEQKEPLLAAINRRISHAMNRQSIDTERNVTSLDATDFVKIARHPRICELRAEAYADPTKINYAYDEAIKVIKTEPEFYNNGLAKAVRAGMVKNNQVTQCVVLRGFPSEVDGMIFPKAIWSCYTFGNTKFYDFVSDSRTAAKSHFYSDTALKDSEYMARKFQLFTCAVENIVYQDCGSEQLIAWQVRGETKDKNGSVTYGGDLPLLIGKYYLEDGQTPKDGYKIITGDETHLVGKTIHYRSVLNCKHLDPHMVCHVCAGQLSENISRFTNIGHLGAVSTTKDLTQNILSIKHVNTSAAMVKIILGETERKFMNTGPDGTEFYLNATLKSLKPRLVIARDEAPGLIDIQNIANIDQYSLPRISEIEKFALVTGEAGREIPVMLSGKQKTRCSNLSRKLLSYLKEKSWSTDAQNNFVFDMSDWDYSDPILVMPSKEESFVDLAAAVDALVRANLGMLDKRMIKNAPAILLQDLFDLVNSKLKINILSFEIIVYALMVESASSYAMARNAEEPVLGVAKLLTQHRSLGNALAYESMSKVLTNPFSFFQGKRPDSPMDVFLTPREVVEEYKRNGRNGH